jgi:hypothetical protein
MPIRPSDPAELVAPGGIPAAAAAALHAERGSRPVSARPCKGKELGMRASLHRYKVMDAEALIERIQQEFIERVKTIEGLVGYYVIDGGDGTVTSITLGETEQAVEALAVDSQDWIVERAAHLVEGAPDMTAGEVRVRVER